MRQLQSDGQERARSICLMGHFPPTQGLPRHTVDLPQSICRQPAGSLSGHAWEGTKPLKHHTNTTQELGEDAAAARRLCSQPSVPEESPSSPLCSPPAHHWHHHSWWTGFCRLIVGAGGFQDMKRIVCTTIGANKDLTCRHRSLIPPSPACFRIVQV